MSYEARVREADNEKDYGLNCKVIFNDAIASKLMLLLMLLLSIGTE